MSEKKRVSFAGALPPGVVQLFDYEDVRAAWGELLSTEPEEEGGEGEVYFAGNPRIAITADAVYVKLRKPVHAGPDVELTDVVRITEPNVGQLRLTDKYKGEIDKTICLISSLCTIPTTDVHAMGTNDFGLCGEVVSAFLPG